MKSRHIMLAVFAVLLLVAPVATAQAGLPVCPSGDAGHPLPPTYPCRYVPATATITAAQPTRLAQPESVVSSTTGAAQAKSEIPSQSVVIQSANFTTGSDTDQRKAEEEFLAVAIAKERAFYAGDVQGTLSYYADDIISVSPEMEEVVGKVALAEGLKPYLDDNKIVGHLTIKRFWVDGDHASRQAQWEEWVTPKSGGSAEHHIGRCTLNWERIDGQWKVTSEFINYLAPPTPIQ